MNHEVRGHIGIMFYEEQGFSTNLDKWLGLNKQDAAKALEKYKIPPIFKNYTKNLYRGMVVDQDFLDNVKAGKLKFTNYSSWSKDKNLALKFVNDPKYKFTSTGTIKILVTKTFTSTNVVLDIDGLANFLGETGMIHIGIDDLSADSALKEQEVLIKPNVQIKTTDIKVIK